MSERSLLRLNDGVLLYTETTAYNSDVMCACALNIYCYDRYTLLFDDWTGLDCYVCTATTDWLQGVAPYLIVCFVGV